MDRDGRSQRPSSETAVRIRWRAGLQLYPLFVRKVLGRRAPRNLIRISVPQSDMLRMSIIFRPGGVTRPVAAGNQLTLVVACACPEGLALSEELFRFKYPYSVNFAVNDPIDDYGFDRIVAQACDKLVIYHLVAQYCPMQEGSVQHPNVEARGAIEIGELSLPGDRRRISRHAV